MADDPIAPITERFKPPPALTVSEWADAFRMLPDTSAEPGRWRTARAPYLKGVMDAFNDPSVMTMVLEKSAQSGGSEAAINVFGYTMAYDPYPGMIVQPTIDMAEAFSKDRLARTFEVTPALGKLVSPESTLRHLVFPGGFLALAGANSAASLAQRAVRLLMCDDLDRFPVELENEGDPVELAIKRTQTFWNRKIVLVSTPTIRGARIDRWYQRSDQRRFFVPCPSCGRMDYLVFSDPRHMHVVFDHLDDPIARAASARLECPAPEHGGCGGRVEDHERAALVARGEWRPTATSQEPGLVGFHIWEAYSPWGSLREIVAKFLSAREKGRAAMRVWKNTTLGEADDDDALEIEPQGLLGRRYDYGLDVDVPAWVARLTAGVDTQDDGFWLLVLGWGSGEEKAVVDWLWIPGDPAHPQTRQHLGEAMHRRYRHALGPAVSIMATCIDRGGHRADEVDQFVLAHQHRLVYAVRGQAGLSGNRIMGTPVAKRFGVDNSPRLVPLYPVNVDDAKFRLLSDLELLPGPDRRGPGVWHFPRRVESVDEAFFAQLTAEAMITKRTKEGLAFQAWKRVRDANHALDCAVYAYAAFRKLQEFNPNLSESLARIRAEAERLQGQPTVAPAAIAASPAPASTRASTERIVGRSSYLAANRRGSGW